MRRAIGCATFLTIWACGDPETPRVLPTAETTMDGVEVATLSSLPNLKDPRYQWIFRPVREIETVADDPNKPLVFNPQALVELGNGTLVVHDPQGDQVFAVLDGRGSTVLHRFGRPGEGPSEFGSWLFLAETSEGFAVLDPRNRRIHRYSPSAELISRERLQVDNVAGKAVASRRGGGFLLEVLEASQDEWHREVVRVDAIDGATDPMARLPDPPSYAELGRIQRGRVVWTSVNGRVVGMWSDRPTLSVFDRDGSLAREIQLPITRRVLTERDIQAQIDEYGAIARRLRPGPAALTNELYTLGDSIFGLFTSELWKAAEDPPLAVGRVWWRLFTVRGEYVGVVALPEDFWPLGVSERGIWARVLDESGYPLIQELELVRRELD